ncbi:aspartyl-phosphate phosphatase Spo0E family protein [Anaeromicrobium sediminis]|uniref:Spo0E family sporulation regulatory protein-aspartic acid phosphatase n=1 Tax=Anaeromicrobium sediminis TaxID=1478221 RepID=A0A267MGT2_9FIRM|nr:aspartyl-phosphate phosphatase Spo0E family protein [Anaeromicrobium sediminis]PAB58612.1 hypothetical protein CCE28_14100 [Anaeromicrobium sediminis]
MGEKVLNYNLLKQINALRKQLEDRLILNNRIVDEKTIKLSEGLDILIVKYYREKNY